MTSIGPPGATMLTPMGPGVGSGPGSGPVLGAGTGTGTGPMLGAGLIGFPPQTYNTAQPPNPTPDMNTPPVILQPPAIQPQNASIAFPARFTAANSMLTSTVPNLFHQYTSAQKNAASLVSQNNALQVKVRELKATLKNIKGATDTYDQEFTDRSAGKRTLSYFQQHGIKTMQDWLFFLFFVFYAMVCISIFSIMVFNAKDKLTTGVMVLISSFIFGVMIAGMMMRFA